MIAILHGHRECLQNVSGQISRHSHAIRLALLSGSTKETKDKYSLVAHCVEQKQVYLSR